MTIKAKGYNIVSIISFIVPMVLFYFSNFNPSVTWILLTTPVIGIILTYFGKKGPSRVIAFSGNLIAIIICSSSAIRLMFLGK
ncbi:exosortase/archaeosortase [Scopulibacillus daqui]|uniref:Exosortase/archaeosortase n=1 Tax=Scopulibacillus daqui TaxID=1469162 RepID=A0ABS2PVV2_9BACL|nr:hypothetical protein [Scopulibacillus daqui]MBM7644184.1 exosortase/archaeosortase [Scopulibacillus daqui]